MSEFRQATYTPDGTMTAQTVPEHVAQIRPEPEHDVEKVAPTEDVHDPSDDKPGPDDEGKQGGVKKIEATASVWSTKMLWVMFAMIYLVTFVDMLLQSVQSELVPYVTSAFNSHGLLSTTSVVSSINGGVSKLTIAKIIDIWGRAQGFAVMLLLIIIGMIMKATCQNVETYAAAQTIFWVGHLGFLYTLDIMIADMTSLKNRMIMIGINTTPTIATTFAGPKIAELFYNNVNFRWAFGSFAIILAGFSIPMFVMFVLEETKAKRVGILVKKDNGRTFWQSCQFYFWEFDVVGMLLTTAGFALILLPFSLAQSFPKGWADAGPICMLVFGVVSLILFAVWEKYFARVSYLPFQFLKDRTILGASMTYGVMFLSIYCWDTYYSSYLQVVHNLSISHSGYILNSYSLMSSFLSPFVGVAIAQFGRFKHIAMFSGIPLIALGTGLLTHFRVPGAYVGYLAMCQIFNGAAGGILAMTSHIAIFSTVSHQEIAVVYAIYGLFGSIGAAIGLAIAGAIWTNVLPQKLVEFLPEDSKNLSSSIYKSLPTQLSYPMGSPVRDAIIEAYSDVQKKMVIAGGCFIPLLAACVFIWRDINVKKVEQEGGRQTKGNVW